MLNLFGPKPVLTGMTALALAASIVSASPAGAVTRPFAHQALAGGHTRTQASGFSDWPMFLGGPAHLGVSPETAISVTTAPTLTPGWTAPLGSTGSYASPAVATSTSLSEALVYAGSAANFYAFSAASGSLVWQYTLGSGNVQASPAVFGGVVYVASSSGVVFALNASTGALLCDFGTGQHIQASPVVVSAPGRLRAGAVCRH